MVHAASSARAQTHQLANSAVTLLATLLDPCGAPGQCLSSAPSHQCCQLLAGVCASHTNSVPRYEWGPALLLQDSLLQGLGPLAYSPTSVVCFT